MQMAQSLKEAGLMTKYLGRVQAPIQMEIDSLVSGQMEKLMEMVLYIYQVGINTKGNGGTGKGKAMGFTHTVTAIDMMVNGVMMRGMDTV